MIVRLKAGNYMQTEFRAKGSGIGQRISAASRFAGRGYEVQGLTHLGGGSWGLFGGSSRETLPEWEARCRGIGEHFGVYQDPSKQDVYLTTLTAPTRLYRAPARTEGLFTR